MSLLLVGAVCSGVGCGLPAKWHAKADQLPRATPEDPVTTILCIWEPAEGQDPEGKPCRGFAGQVLFFTRKQKTPVRVSGDVRVYVYDDQGPPEKQGEPLHQWEFIGDAWAIHLADSNLGPSYSVFIPYTRKGNHQAQCALRVRFTPDNGRPLYSDTAAIVLPGKFRKKEDTITDQNVEKRTALDSITIPLKEKRKAELLSMPLGQSEIHRTTGPVSDLPKRNSRGSTRQTRPPAEESGDVAPQAPEELQSLPAAPQQFTPPQSAQPVESTPRPGSAAVRQSSAQEESAQAPTTTRHSFAQEQSSPAPARTRHAFQQEEFQQAPSTTRFQKFQQGQVAPPRPHVRSQSEELREQVSDWPEHSESPGGSRHPWVDEQP